MFTRTKYMAEKKYEILKDYGTGFESNKEASGEDPY